MWHRPVEDWFRFVQIIFFSLFFRFAVDGTKRSSYWGPEFFFSFTWGVVFFHALPASFFLTRVFFFLRTSTPSDHGVLSEARLMHFRRQSHARCVCLFMPLYFFSQVYQLTTTVCFVGPDWTVRFFPLLLCFSGWNTVCVYFVFSFSVNPSAALVLLFTIYCSVHLTGAVIWPFLLELGQQNEIYSVQAF